MGFISGAVDAVSSLFGGKSLADMVSGALSDIADAFSASHLFGPSCANSVTDGISSTMQGPNPPAPGAAGKPSMMEGIGSAIKDLPGSLISSAGQEGISSLMNSTFHNNDAANLGKAAHQYLKAAFPELTPWERAGAGGSMSGIQDAGFENQKELIRMQLDNQKDIAEIQSKTAKQVAGINAVTSRQNTSDQVFAQNSMLTYNQKQAEANINKIVADTDLSVQQKAESITRVIMQNAQTQGIKLSNHQIPVITQKVKAEIENTRADTVNKKGSQSTYGKIASDIVHAWHSTINPASPRPSSDSSPVNQVSVFDTPVLRWSRRNADNFYHAGGVRGSMSRK